MSAQDNRLWLTKNSLNQSIYFPVIVTRLVHRLRYILAFDLIRIRLPFFLLMIIDVMMIMQSEIQYKPTRIADGVILVTYLNVLPQRPPF